MPTDIEWTQFPGTIGETWNPINATRLDSGKRGWHCEPISPGCKNCYAGVMNQRNLPGCGTGLAYTVPNRELVQLGLHGDTLDKPLHWRQPRTVFVCSMTDLFAEFHSYEMIREILGKIGVTPRHRYIALTKRARRAREILTRFYKEWDQSELDDETRADCAGRSYQRGPATPFQNLIVGVSVESQHYLKRLDILRETPAACRMVSFEPLLEHLGGFDTTGIDWAVIGGESGTHARDCDMRWIISAAGVCYSQGTAVFVKQMGSRPRLPETEDGLLDLLPGPVRRRPDGSLIFRDRKGGEPSEWVPELRHREFPAGVAR